MAIVSRRPRLRSIWSVWKSAAQLERSPPTTEPRATNVPGDSFLPQPIVSPVHYDPNASEVKGREVSTSNTKKSCNNRPVLITKQKLGKRSYGNALSSNIGLRAWCTWDAAKVATSEDKKPASKSLWRRSSRT